MPSAAFRTVVGRLHRGVAAVTDGQLLTRFVTHRDEAAFAELVARLGPTVFAVCRRRLGDHHAAEDAFQTVFVVLARKAHTVCPPDAVAGWVYGVALRAVLEASAVKRRRNRETLVAAVPDVPAPQAEDGPEPDTLAVLDAEVAGLSEPYRSAVVLCELRGVSRREAARRLGVPEGTLSSRLASARKLLAARLRARGVALSAAGLSAALAGSARAAVPTKLEAAAVTAALAGPIPGGVSVLTHGVLRSMSARRLKWATAGLVLVVGIVFGVSRLIPTPVDGPAPQVPPDRPTKIWLTFPGGRLTTLDPDGRRGNTVELKEGRMVRKVSPAHNLVWFDGKDGRLPDPLPEERPDGLYDRSGLTLHVRPLNDPDAKATDLGIDSLDVIYFSHDGRTAFDRNRREWTNGMTHAPYMLVDGVTGKRTPYKFPIRRGIMGALFVQDIAPDGSWVVAFENTSELPNRRSERLPQGRLHKVPIDGGEPVLLTGRLNAWGLSQPSPDGRRLLTFARPEPDGKGAEWRSGALYVIDVATQTVTKIAEPESTEWIHGVWSPDGRSIAYIWDERPAAKDGVPDAAKMEPRTRRLVVCDADGKNARVILTTEEYFMPIAWLADGK